eukprot:Gregarina_sp_Poly_1__2894@NODE_1809_length_3292_cov_167_926512_g1174_i0_p3_GENE_NODE_1809_length_3292_cov_167_926512_g1174_i0NODE_1809_length_3292_cov_167_926512_g1174_i0_p3_ORF_typecomplete_len234_score14_96Fboxlike_2/PF13013_6/0_33_NODE_1809_length_3292_cov_167_926512_g1174_i013972098
MGKFIQVMKRCQTLTGIGLLRQLASFLKMNKSLNIRNNLLNLMVNFAESDHRGQLDLGQLVHNMLLNLWGFCAAVTLLAAPLMAARSTNFDNSLFHPHPYCMALRPCIWQIVADYYSGQPFDAVRIHVTLNHDEFQVVTKALSHVVKNVQNTHCLFPVEIIPEFFAASSCRSRDCEDALVLLGVDLLCCKWATLPDRIRERILDDHHNAIKDALEPRMSNSFYGPLLRRRNCS